MILLLSEPTDHSTGEVVSWLNYYGLSWFRINDFNFAKNLKSELSLSKRSFELLIDGIHVNYDDISSIWYRRDPEVKNNPYDFLKNIEDREIVHYAHQELGSIFFLFLSFLSKKKWLGDPALCITNKLHNLKLAAELGINIPETIVTSNKNELISFQKKHEKIIVKPAYSIVSVSEENTIYKTYTSLVSSKWLENLPETFFPCLIQKCVEKQYEIRTFFINDNFYSMAIFSQANEQTNVDYRKGNFTKQNRKIPYKLPEEFAAKIYRFMKSLGLNTGSLDIICNEKNEYIFLEVNPVGQFGAVSKVCNYYLEQEIAHFLKG